MQPSDQVRLKSDPTQQGVIIASGMRRGAASHQIVWFDNPKTPAWHPESELELLPAGGVNNTITGTVTGTVIQGHTFHGPVNQ